MKISSSGLPDDEPQLGVHIEYVKSLMAQGGPREAQYPEFDAWLRCIYSLVTSGRLSADNLNVIRAAFGEALVGPGTNQGFAYTKPHGYAGDYEIMDRIYLRHVSSDPHLAAWDHYWNQHPAPRSNHHRKAVFHGLLDRHTARVGSPRILKLGLGPGRCMHEWFKANPAAPVHLHCVDIDPDSIAYATELNRAFLERLTFQQANVLRFRPTGVFDLIWSGGLFDYFGDRVFVSVLKRLIPAIAPGGELVLSHYAKNDICLPQMCFLDWNIFYRDPDELIGLALEAGAERSRISVAPEPAGVNLFLTIGSR
jgi:SAM-dependent methyltransferase